MASTINPASGGPSRAAAPLTKVRTPKEEVSSDRPAISTRRGEVTDQRAEREIPGIITY